jgi:hypothetical protein
MVAAGLVLLAGAGCHKPVPPVGALVLAQSPVNCRRDSGL